MHEVMHKNVLTVDYPRPNETITSDNYTFRIVAMPGVKKVEISVDGAPWQPCRQSEGSFWYDWSGYRSGEHEVAARVQLADGPFHTTGSRFFNVELQHDRFRNGGEHRTLSPRRAQQLLSRPDLRKYLASKLFVVVPNQPAVLRRLTRLLSQENVRAEGVLIETFGDIVSFRILAEQVHEMRRSLEREGFHVTEEKVFRLELGDRPGEIDELTRKLADQGIAVRYLYGTSQGRRTNVVLSVDRPEDAFEIVRESSQELVAAEA